MVDPLSVTAPDGVCRSSGMMKVRMIRLAPSSSIGGLGTSSVASSLMKPITPTGMLTITWKRGAHFPGCSAMKNMNLKRPSP